MRLQVHVGCLRHPEACPKGRARLASSMLNWGQILKTWQFRMFQVWHSARLATKTMAGMKKYMAHHHDINDSERLWRYKQRTNERINDSVCHREIARSCTTRRLQLVSRTRNDGPCIAPPVSPHQVVDHTQIRWYVFCIFCAFFEHCDILWVLSRHLGSGGVFLCLTLRSWQVKV